MDANRRHSQYLAIDLGNDLIHQAAGENCDGEDWDNIQEAGLLLKKMNGLLDRARNWVQDPELRAEITALVPPRSRDAL